MSTRANEPSRADRELLARMAGPSAIPPSLRAAVIARADALCARDWVAQGIPVVKSWRHADCGLCSGGDRFIVSARLATGPVSGHYESKHWDLFDVPERVYPPVWASHTPEGVTPCLGSTPIPDTEEE